MLAAVNAVAVAITSQEDRFKRFAFISSDRTKGSPNSSRPVVFGGRRARKGCVINSHSNLSETFPRAATAPFRSKDCFPPLKWATSASITSAPKYAEGRAARIDVESAKQAAVVKMLVDIKRAG